MGCTNTKSGQPILEPSLVIIQSQPQIQAHRPINVKTLEDLKFDHARFVAHKTTPITDDYLMGPRLGTGAFGSVRRAVHKITNQHRAIKTLKKSGITADMKGQSTYFSEVDILRQADHPNIVKMYEFYEDAQSFHIVTEVMKGGELFDFIVLHKKLTEALAAHFMKQILGALSYCHSNGIVHRDIKPENLLLDSSSHDATLKMIDFGTSTLCYPAEKLHHKYGTAYYIAPEVLKREYDEKCDIWSCGVILYILLSGRPPFYGKSDEDILAKVRVGKYSFKGSEWRCISAEAKELITKMLDMKPERRPSAVEALHDKWFLQVSNTPALETQIYLESFENLKKFHADKKLQQAVMAFITSQLVTKEDTKQLTQAFRKLDTNGDGKLSKEEMFKGYSELLGAQQAEPEVERIMAEVDVDANGYIEYSEFVMASMKKDTLLSRENLDNAFSIFDEDGSGTISAAELRKVLGGDIVTSDSIWSELIRSVDQNGDGEIDIKEFKEMMLKSL